MVAAKMIGGPKKYRGLAEESEMSEVDLPILYSIWEEPEPGQEITTLRYSYILSGSYLDENGKRILTYRYAGREDNSTTRSSEGIDGVSN